MNLRCAVNECLKLAIPGRERRQIDR